MPCTAICDCKTGIVEKFRFKKSINLRDQEWRVVTFDFFYFPTKKYCKMDNI